MSPFGFSFFLTFFQSISTRSMDTTRSIKKARADPSEILTAVADRPGCWHCLVGLASADPTASKRCDDFRCNPKDQANTQRRPSAASFFFEEPQGVIDAKGSRSRSVRPSHFLRRYDDDDALEGVWKTERRMAQGDRALEKIASRRMEMPLRLRCGRIYHIRFDARAAKSLRRASVYTGARWPECQISNQASKASTRALRPLRQRYRRRRPMCRNWRPSSHPAGIRRSAC